METTISELPFFPVPAEAPFAGDPQPVLDVMLPVFDDLATVIAEIAPADLARRTPCADFDVVTLRDHVLGWLQYFAAALADPQRQSVRPDPVAYRAADTEQQDLAGVVRAAAATIEAAVRAGIQQQDVAMSQARMTGASVLGMALGEYVVHGWDLARATGQAWTPPAAASEAALTFFTGMIQPAYRGPDSGFFLDEIKVADDASPLQRLLGFAGRDPNWS